MTTPNLSLVSTTFPQLFAVMRDEVSFFSGVLDKAVLEHAGMAPEDLHDATHERLLEVQGSVAKVDHLSVIEEAVVKNPALAARALMPAIYLGGAIIHAQERGDEAAGSVGPSTPEQLAAAALAEAE